MFSGTIPVRLWVVSLTLPWGDFDSVKYSTPSSKANKQANHPQVAVLEPRRVRLLQPLAAEGVFPLQMPSFFSQLWYIHKTHRGIGETLLRS